jgi:hypothetical protein
MAEIEIETIPASQPILILPAPPIKIPVPWWSKIWSLLWPKLIWILTPILFIGRLLIVCYFRTYARLFTDEVVNDQAKCPACGLRAQHKIKYVPDYEKVFHQCGRCDAEWGEKTIQPPEKWRVIHPIPEKKDRRLG